MIRSAAAALGAALALSCAGSAQAGIYSDDLTRCVVKKATDADRTALMLWVFSAMSLHPQVRAHSNLTEAQRETIARDAARVMMRLISADCRSETVSAVKFEGVSAFEGAFEVLGQVAMRQLMTDPAVSAWIAQLDKYGDRSAMEALLREAGVPMPGK